MHGEMVLYFKIFTTDVNIYNSLPSTSYIQYIWFEALSNMHQYNCMCVDHSRWSGKKIIITLTINVINVITTKWIPRCISLVFSNDVDCAT